MAPSTKPRASFLSLADTQARHEAKPRRADHRAGYAEPEVLDPRIRTGMFHHEGFPFVGFGCGTLLLRYNGATAEAAQIGKIVAFVHDPGEIGDVTPDSWIFLWFSLQVISENPDELL